MQRLFVGTALVSTAFGILVALTHAPWWMGPAVAALVFVIVVAFLPHLSLDRSDRQLVIVDAIASEDTSRRWQRAFPGLAEPRFRNEVEAWLAAGEAGFDDFDANVLQASGLTWIGRYADARHRVERLRITTHMDAFVRELLVAKIEYQEGGPGSLEEARRLGALTEGVERRVVVAELGFEDAARAVVAGDDWGPIIDAAAREVGGLSLRVLLLSGFARILAPGSRIVLVAGACALAVGAVEKALQ